VSEVAELLEEEGRKGRLQTIRYIAVLVPGFVAERSRGLRDPLLAGAAYLGGTRSGAGVVAAAPPIGRVTRVA